MVEDEETDVVFTAVLSATTIPLYNVTTLEDALLHSRALFGKTLIRVEQKTTTIRKAKNLIR